MQLFLFGVSHHTVAYSESCIHARFKKKQCGGLFTCRRKISSLFCEENVQENAIFPTFKHILYIFDQYCSSTAAAVSY